MPDIEEDESRCPVVGQVRWKFKFTWISGGEDFSLEDQSPLLPWWDSGGGSHLEQPTLPKGYHVLPPQLYQDLDAFHHDIPPGWHCTKCGKLNVQIFLRHRRCSNCEVSVFIGLACGLVVMSPKSSTSPDPGFALCLEDVREMQQTIWTSLPHDLCPDGMEHSVVVWGDGMQTFSYGIQNNVVAKHIFTCNQPTLQEEPTMLFHDFQLHVHLSRQQDKKFSGTRYFSVFALL